MPKTLYSKLVATKIFRGVTTKDAYMDACKWYAVNVVSGNDMNDVLANYIKVENGVVKMELYASLDCGEVMENHCNCCREMHKSFFINEDTHCDRCSSSAFMRRINGKMDIKIQYYKDTIKRIISR